MEKSPGQMRARWSFRPLRALKTRAGAGAAPRGAWKAVAPASRPRSAASF